MQATRSCNCLYHFSCTYFFYKLQCQKGDTDHSTVTANVILFMQHIMNTHGSDMMCIIYNKLIVIVTEILHQEMFALIVYIFFYFILNLYHSLVFPYVRNAW